MDRTGFSVRLLLVVALSTAISALPAGAQASGADQWTWMGGSQTVSAEFGIWPGVYGTKGTPAPANIPGTRIYESTWTGSDGRFWLFGGLTFTTGLNYFNDLWVFDPGANEWAWIAGDSSIGNNCPIIATLANCGQPGVYGTMGKPAAANSPGARESAESWSDASGHLWLYGGLGFDGAGNFVQLDDLWEFDPSTSEWAWIGGDSAIPLDPSCPNYLCYSGEPPVPGTQGSAAAGNTPGSLWLGTNWTDHNGDFWLFAGWGMTLAGGGAVANDLWKYSPSSREWTWIGGSPNFGINGRVPGIYGTLGTPALGNFPGTRWQDATWVDESGNLWLFGGEGADAAGIYEGILNDLWEFNPTTSEWAWMGGSSTFSCANYPQQYCHQNGVYGMLGQPSPQNIPGSRYQASSWRDNDGNFWLFGGNGFDSVSDWSYMNDLWEFNPTANEWTWMGGSSNTSEGSVTGVYGTIGVPSAANVPGIRSGSASWTDKNGFLWLWGGTGIDSAGVYGYENDLWRYQPSSAVSPTAIPVFSPAPGAYSSAQSVTISDTTAGATIYYTTDGTTPTASSTLYTGPIMVTQTETIQAVAKSPNGTMSAVASAIYTINIAADFTLAIKPQAITVERGSSATATITVQDEGSFDSNVAFACSGLPPGVACSFTLETLPTHAGLSYTTLTLTASQNSAAQPAYRISAVPGSILAAAVCFLGWKKRRRMHALLLALAIAWLGVWSGCADVHMGNGYSVSTVTVTATSGALSHSTSFTLTVN